MTSSTSNAVASTSNSLSPSTPPTTTPTDLVTAWKKEGAFDSIRKQSMSDFNDSLDKQELLKELDEMLPELMKDPAFVKMKKKDRLIHLNKEIEKRLELFKEASVKMERALREKEQASNKKRPISDGLRRTLKRIKGEEAEDDDDDNDEEEQEEEDEIFIARNDPIIPKEERSQATPINGDLERPQEPPPKDVSSGRESPKEEMLPNEGPAPEDVAQPDVPTTVRTASPGPVVPMDEDA